MKEIEAAEKIVTNCRVYLSRKLRNRLENDLIFVQQRKKSVDEKFQLNQSVVRIQKVFRGSKIREGVRRYVEKTQLLYFAYTAFKGTLGFDRRRRIATLKKRRMDLLDLLDIHETYLHSLQLQTQKRASNPIYNISLQLQNSDEPLSNSIMKSWQEIMNAIDDAFDLTRKLRAKNDAHVERFDDNLSVLHHNDNVIQSIQRFLNSRNKSLPYYNSIYKLQSNQHEVERMQLACHDDLERILLRENTFISSDMNSLLYGSNIIRKKIDYLMKLRGFEAEQLSLRIFIRNRPVKSKDAARFVRHVDYLEDQIYKNRGFLVDIFKDIEQFLIQEDKRMNSMVLFKKDGNRHDAICKIIPNGEPLLLNFKKWKDAYQQCINTTNDTEVYQRSVKLRDYIDEWCKSSNESEMFSASRGTSKSASDPDVCKRLNINHFIKVFQSVKQRFIFIFQGIVKVKLRVSPTFISERNNLTNLQKSSTEYNQQLDNQHDHHLSHIISLLKLTTSECDELRKCFDSFKPDDNGTIRFDDVLKSFAYSPNFLRVIQNLVFASFDPPKDLKLSFGEFARGFCSFSIMSTTEIVRRTFFRLDTSSCGYISNEQLRDFIYLIQSNDSLLFGRMKDELVKRSYSINDFFDIHLRYPLFMFPVLKCRELVQDLVLSKKTFQRKARQLIAEGDLY